MHKIVVLLGSLRDKTHKVRVVVNTVHKRLNS